MYKINDFIIYGRTGVCKVIDITTPKNSSFDQNQLYYVLKPLVQDYEIYTPVNTNVFMRPIISQDEAKRLIDMIPAMQTDIYFSSQVKNLTQHYEEAIKSHDCADLIKLAMSIYAKKLIAEQQNRKVGTIDERYIKLAEELLHSEFSLVLGIPKEKIPEYIALRVAEMKKN
jgi:Transcriptional regulators, similar to M. xanthus CarD